MPFAYDIPRWTPTIQTTTTPTISFSPTTGPTLSISPTLNPTTLSPTTNTPTISHSPTISPSLYITYHGYDYSTLANVNPDGSDVLCQGYGNYLSVPSGWELVPYSSDALTVIQAHTWSTNVIVLSNGYSYWTGSAIDKLANSYAGILGKKIEPVIKPLGYDWKIGIALITSFAAREVFVGTMATLYSVEEDNNSSLREKLRASVWPDGKPVYSLATALSLMVFYVLAMQCMSTLAIVKRETGTWKWPTIQFFMMTGLAYVLSWLTYVIAK